MMKDSRSNLSDLAVFDFDDGFLELFDAFLFEIELTLMVLRHPMGVTEYELAFAFDSEQPHFLLASEASFTILLNLLSSLLNFRSFFLLEDRSDFFDFGSFWLYFQLGLFLLLCLDALSLLVARRAEPVSILGTVEGMTVLAEGCLGGLGC